MAALGTLERFVSWDGAAGEAARIQCSVQAGYPGDPVLSTGSSEPLHTDVSPPHSTEP